MSIEARVQHLANLRVPGEECGDLAAVLVVLAHADGESLDAAEDEPAFKRRENAAGALLNEAESLRMLGRVGDEDAAESVGMSVEKFGGRVHDDVGAEFERALQVRRHKSVIDGDRDAVLVTDVGDRADVGEGHERVGGRLNVDELRGGTDGAADVVGVRGVDETELDAVVRNDLGEEARGAAIDVVAADHMVADFEHGDESGDGGHAAGEGVSGGSSFQRREAGLNGVAGRVRDAGVFPAAVFFDALQLIGGGEIDGNVDGAGARIGLLPVVDGSSGETVLVVCHVRNYVKGSRLPARLRVLFESNGSFVVVLRWDEKRESVAFSRVTVFIVFGMRFLAMFTDSTTGDEGSAVSGQRIEERRALRATRIRAALGCGFEVQTSGAVVGVSF
jgi:hypothetical protein